MKIACKLETIRKKYCWDKVDNKLFSEFNTHLMKIDSQKKEAILVQCVEDYYYFSLFGQIITDIRKNNDVKVEQYVLRNVSVGDYSSFWRFIKTKLFINKWTDRKWTNLYGAYCNQVAFSNEQSLGFYNDSKLFFKAWKIAESIQTKEDLVALKVEGLLVGDLIYDTYLRFKPAPTLDISDFYLIVVIWKALRNIKISQQYFTSERPRAVLQSYSTYIQHGITARVALEFGVDVYTFGNYLKMMKKLSKNDYSHAPSTSQYNVEFEGFYDKEKKLLQAEKALESRLAGNIDLATSYMRESAYKKSLDVEVPAVDGAVVVFLHDFYDSPHIYNSMIFADFLEWAEFTIKELENNSILYYLKPHPNQLPESAQVVRELQNKNPNANLLSSKVTNKQLVDAGMKVGVTVYGTIAHELAYMGIPVITCGDNPHSSYNFCFEAKSKEQYSQMLKEIDNLNYSDIEKIKSEVKSFYYMHNLNKSNEEKELLKQFSKLRDVCVNFDGEHVYGVYLGILNEIRNNTEYKRIIGSINE